MVEPFIKAKHAPITGYRLLVSVSAVSFGLAKATLSYRNAKVIVPSAVEWVYGVVVTLRYVTYP